MRNGCNSKGLAWCSTRTKNRINEFGPEFNIGREMPVVCFGSLQVRARLLHSISKDWVGWVPADEVKIEIVPC